jgi:hypothetical protein
MREAMRRDTHGVLTRVLTVEGHDGFSGATGVSAFRAAQAKSRRRSRRRLLGRLRRLRIAVQSGARNADRLADIVHGWCTATVRIIEMVPSETPIECEQAAQAFAKPDHKAL